MSLRGTMRDVKINKRRRWELTPPPSPFINQPATLLLDATCYQSSPSLPGGGRRVEGGARVKQLCVIVQERKINN